jgi:hypothetical protein
MAARYGTVMVDGREESYAEDDDFEWQGDNYTVRVVALPPYKDYANGSDKLFCTLVATNINTGKVDTFERVWVDERNPNEASGHLRRHSVYRTLTRLMRGRSNT